MKSILIFLLIFGIFVHAQEVEYFQRYNGVKSEQKITFWKMNNWIYYPAKNSLTEYIDFTTQKYYTVLKLDDNSFKTETSFSEFPTPTFGDKKAKILGYNCRYASYNYFSNKVEVWYTEKAKLQGSPLPKFLPTPQALVLKIIINDNQVIEAERITSIKNPLPLVSLEEIPTVTSPVFEEKKINSRFTRIPIFENDTINWNSRRNDSITAFMPENSFVRRINGSLLLKKIRLTPELLQSENLFLKLTETSNDDAYDRLGTVFIIPITHDSLLNLISKFQHSPTTFPKIYDAEGKDYEGVISDSSYHVPIELMRFITSFGAGFFNEKRVINNYNWAKEVRYKQEVTSLFRKDVEEYWVGIHIGTYSAGGHKVTMELEAFPSASSEKTEKKNFVLPLFSTLNFVNSRSLHHFFRDNSLKLDFQLPENIQNVQLLYTPTGHGGWENGDEFIPRLNTLKLDGELLFQIMPWRTDCATYRFLNPASGNFANGMSSSDYSRSNWCPATTTPPYVIPLTNLKAGKHTLEVIINQGPDEGSSTNSWHVTGMITGEYSSQEINTQN